MQMIGHDDVHIRADRLVDTGQLVPNRLDHLAGCAQHHLPVLHIAEYRNAAVGADGDDVRTGQRVVVIFQAERPAVVDIGII